VFGNAFGGMSLLFSACLLGKYQSELEEFKKNSGLSYVAGFTKEVCDWEALIFNVLLYTASQ
jgi:hypothetical protein